MQEWQRECMLQAGLLMDVIRQLHISHQTPETGRGDYRIQVNGQHKADHTKEAQVLTISFNQNVTYVSGGAGLISGNGTPTLKVKLSYHQNPTDNIGFGDLVVTSDAGLSISSVSITD